MQPFRLSLSGAFLLILGLAAGAIGLSLGANRAIAAQHNVSITDFAFTPASITVDIGDTVQWTNSTAGTVHNVTSNTGTFNSGNLNGGQNFSYTFAATGTFGYRCTIHPSMTGTVTVVGPTPTSTQVNTPTRTATSSPTNTPVTPPTSTQAVSIPTNPPLFEPTATQTVTHTPTITTPATSTRTPISPIPDATKTPIPVNTNTAVATQPAAATPTRAVPLPPNTGSGTGGSPASLFFLVAAAMLVAGGLSMGALAYRRR